MKTAHALALLFIITYALNFYLPEEVKGVMKRDLPTPKMAINLSIKYLLVMTLALLLAKKILKVNLCIVVDVMVFFMGLIFGALFNHPMAFAIIFLAGRKIGGFEENIVYLASIAYLAILFSKVLTPEAYLVFLAFLTVYDVLGIFYLKYIKTLWLQSEKPSRNKRICGIVIRADDGIIGSGDFLLPVMSSLLHPYGYLFIPFAFLSMLLNRLAARRFGIFPGTVFTAVFTFIFYTFPT